MDKNLLIVQSEYLNYKNERMFNYNNVPTKNQFIHNVTLTEKTNINHSCKGKWIYNYVPKSPFSDEFIMGFYFTSDFELNPVTEQPPQVNAYVNQLQNQSEGLVGPIKNKMAFDKVIRFLEKLVDVCAALFIHHNRPDLIGFSIANLVVPKMTRPRHDSP